jgi:penicillin-insensitive murein endopeptidase
MRRLAATILAAALAWPAAAQPPKAPPTPTWSTVGKPSSGPPRVVGKTAQGCIGGAVGLPLEGPGYQVLRPASRRISAIRRDPLRRDAGTLSVWAATACC